MSDSIEDFFVCREIANDQFLFTGPKTRWRRVYGGLVISQSLAACSRTVHNSKRVHSVHAYFLQPGKPDEGIICEVDRLREGRSFAVRHCRAKQGGQVIFSMTASYHAEEQGFEHFEPAPDVAPPESLMNFAELQRKFWPERSRPIFEYCTEFEPLDIRPVDPDRYFSTPGNSGRNMKGPAQIVWFKSSQPLTDDPPLHEAVLAYASDMTLLDATLAQHGRSVTDGGFQPASLDHAIWFHRPIQADDWLLYVQDSPNASNATGLAIGRIYSRAGTLLASVAQEGLVRPIKK